MSERPQQVEVPDPVREPWRDPSAPVADRVADLLSRMTLEEKVGQLCAYWVAPLRADEPLLPVPAWAIKPLPPQLDEAATAGLGQLSRVFGTEPVLPAAGLERLRLLQRTVMAANRFGIPALVHEECLTGLLSWTATVFPTPLAWGATFNPELVHELAAEIGSTMRKIGAHIGFAPVLDVTRDYRWGCTEETLGDDPYLVSTLGAAYVRGLQSTGVVATVKHFAGYSAATAGRNMGPVAYGPRQFTDVIVEPFVAGVRSGARGVMVSQSEVDGIPTTADRHLLTDVLRGELGFDGLVQADYFAIWNLVAKQGVAGSREEAAAMALGAGIDVELPTMHCYGPPLVAAVRSGLVAEERVDQAASRVLALKCELGLLDGMYEAELAALPDLGPEDLDPPEHRALSRRVAEESVVLLSNDGTLPIRGGSVALIGPLVDDPRALLGCYSFANHNSLDSLKEMSARAMAGLGVRVPTLPSALTRELPGAKLQVSTAEDVDSATAAAREADVCVLMLGDQAGLFGNGTSGEGCDAETLSLPGRQAELADAVLNTGTPTVILLVSGRPYALGDLADRAAAVIQTFFPGEEGATAIAGILSGRIEPSGRLPISIPRHAGLEVGTYLRPQLGGATEVSSSDPTPLYAFGYGLTWTTFSYADLVLDADTIPSNGQVKISATVRNDGPSPGTEVVQLYLSDPVASVVRPSRWLAGWARVRLEAGSAARVEFTVHADRVSFTGVDFKRIVEPGLIHAEIGSSSADLPLRGSFVLDGPERIVGAADRVLTVPATVRLL